MTKPAQKKQIDKFKEAAKELGCNESEEAFDAKLESIAKGSPPKGEKVDSGYKSKRP